jgi:hypothetical protein
VFDRLDFIGSDAEVEIEPLGSFGFVNQELEGVVCPHERETSLRMEWKRAATPRSVEPIESFDYVVRSDLLASRRDFDIRLGAVIVRFRAGRVTVATPRWLGW